MVVVFEAGTQTSNWSTAIQMHAVNRNIIAAGEPNSTHPDTRLA